MAGDEPAGAGERDADGGVLYVVATPIGNLRDISKRALDVLDSVDSILAEDTRHSAKLLAHYGITTPCRSFHDHNEARQVARIVEAIGAGERMALISDAGTPLISDPGYRLVAALRARGHTVVPVPGASALVCALSVSGLATDRFCFEGFLPAKSGARRRRLQALAAETRTLIFYESPRRVRQTLVDLSSELGARRQAVAMRELTKLHESVIGESLGALHRWFEAHEEQCRGEFVLIVAGAVSSPSDDSVQFSSEQLLRALLEELPVSRAVSVAARLTGAKRNALYRQAVALAKAVDGDRAPGDA